MANEKKRYFIKPERYWEWRTTIGELKAGEREVKIAQLESKIKQMELAFANINLKDKTNQLSNIKQSYTEFIKELEKEVGITIKGKVIEPINFEIIGEEDLKNGIMPAIQDEIDLESKKK